MRLGLVGATLALLACSDAFAPSIGERYMLSSVNGHPIPWTLPGNPDVEPAITEGWIEFLDGAVAQRHERLSRWVIGPSGDSLPLIAEWTTSADYTIQSGRIVLTYQVFGLGQGPSRRVDTLSVSGNGLLLRETGYIPPIDSIVRRYCKVTGC